MTAAEVLDVANVLATLQREYGIDTDPGLGPLRVADLQFIADSVAQDWNTYATARELAARVKARLPAA